MFGLRRLRGGRGVGRKDPRPSYMLGGSETAAGWQWWLCLADACMAVSGVLCGLWKGEKRGNCFGREAAQQRQSRLNWGKGHALRANGQKGKDGQGWLGVVGMGEQRSRFSEIDFENLDSHSGGRNYDPWWIPPFWRARWFRRSRRQ